MFAAVLAILKRTSWFRFATVLRDVRKKRAGLIRNVVDMRGPVTPIEGPKPHSPSLSPPRVIVGPPGPGC